MAVREVVTQGEELGVRLTERVREPEILRVKGFVLGIALTDRVMLMEMV